jgi:hypothetical protein
MDENNNAILEKEIDLIQSCINRMAQNSFIVKGWTVTLIAVVFALLPEKIDIKLLCGIGFIITICFWYLDSFFLKTERLYQWKYEWVIENRLNTNLFCYNLNPHNKGMWLLNGDNSEKKEPLIIRIMVTKTLLPIYLPLIFLEIGFFIYSFV